DLFTFVPGRFPLPRFAQTTTWHNAVQVRVQIHVLAPSMEYCNHPHSTAKMFGIVPKLLQGLPGSPEQTAVNYFAVAQSIAVKLAWKGKYQVKIGNVQEFAFPCPDPLFTFVPLTGWAMPVPATIVTDVQSVATIAFINMPTHGLGAAPPYGLQSA